MNEEFNLASIETLIYLVRGHRVMLDSDLAKLYQVETFNLNKAVKRNILRFPDDFMFQLSGEEYQLIKNDEKLEKTYGGRRSNPYVFTENGVAMLSSILNSERAILVNISIMRIFTKLRSFLMLERTISERMDKLEIGTSKLFKIVFERLDTIEQEAPTHSPGRKKIGLKNILK